MVDSGSQQASLEEVRTIQAFSSEILVLSLAWRPDLVGGADQEIAVGLSNGGTAVLRVDRVGGGDVREVVDGAHSLEVWSVAWPHPADDPNVLGSLLYSGGDDCKLRDRWVVPGGKVRLREDTKTHGAGVTAIFPLGESLLGFMVTGSYDEYVRVVFPNEGRRWKVEADVRLGGGVWRLKLLQSQETKTDKGSGQRFLVLASCMHAGVRVLEISCDNHGWTIKVVAMFEEHESMNYGSDAISNMEGETQTFTVASTSFYDKRLCIWRFSRPEYES